MSDPGPGENVDAGILLHELQNINPNGVYDVIYALNHLKEPSINASTAKSLPVEIIPEMPQYVITAIYDLLLLNLFSSIICLKCKKLQFYHVKRHNEVKHYVRRV